MSSVCPVCQTPVGDEFGIINCSNCQAILSIGIDGSVELQEDSPQVESPGNPYQATNTIAAPQFQEGVDFGGGSEFVSEEPQQPPHSEPPIENQDPEPFGFEMDPEESPIHIRQDQPIAEMHDEPIEQEEQFAPKPEQSPPTSASPKPRRPLEVKRQVSEDLADLADFGNSDISRARDGAILIDISIAGIDTPELRAEVREALTDKRFLWNVDDDMKDLENGQLILRQVNPVKTVVLVNRLKHLSLEIEWTQNAIHQP